MNVYIFFLKTLSILLGVGAIDTAAIFYFQYKKISALSFAGFLGGIFMFIFSDWLYYLSGYIPGLIDDPGFIIFRFLTAPGFFLFSYFGIKFIYSLFGKNVKPLIFYLLLIFSAALYTVSIFNLFGFIIDMIPIVFVTLYMLFFLLKRHKDIVDQTLMLAIKVLVIISLCLTPFFILLLVNQTSTPLHVALNIYQIILSSLSIYFAYIFFNRKPYVDKGATTDLFNGKYNITKREQNIIEQVYLGKSSKEIADILHISARTVTTHLTNIYSKVGVNSRYQLINLLGSNSSV